MSAPTRLLLVEDDRALAELVRGFLEEQGFEVFVEERGDRVVARVAALEPAVVVLDLGLPGRDGLTVCRELRPQYGGALVILTARGDEVDEVVGLELGADDYVTKPVRPRVLVARIRAALRVRYERRAEGPMDFGPLRIDPSRREVTLDGRPVELSTAEFDLLLVLARAAGRVIGRDAIAEALGTPAYDGLSRTIDLRVSRLRRALGEDPKRPVWIKSVRGAGYLFAGPAPDRGPP
jgi:DNA-binding response OmpR family regulator